MGNSQSQSSSLQGTASRRFSSPKPNRNGSRSATSSPKAPQPHRSLRTKKKSLELPDLALLSLNTTDTHPSQAAGNYRGRSLVNGPTKTHSIPIPPQSQVGSNEGYLVQSPSHIEYARSGARNGKSAMGRRDSSNSSRGRGRPPVTYAPYAPSNLSSTNASVSGSEDFHHSAGSSPTPPQMQPFTSTSTPEKEYPAVVVRSSIPLALTKALEPAPALILEGTRQPRGSEIMSVENLPSRDSLEEIMVKISWHGGGQNVLLARAGDDDWKGRKKMEKEDPDGSTFSVTIPLLPGTHHLRFLVDDQWRVADDLPTAVDDQGSLANYVAVGSAIDGAGSPTSDVGVKSRTSVDKVSIEGTPRLSTDQGTLGRAAADAMAGANGNLAPNLGRLANGHSFWSAASSIGDGQDNDQDDIGVNSSVKYTPRWTQEIPLELIEAAQEEEEYLAYQNSMQQQAQYYGANGRTQHVTGFVPLPNIPPSPRLPRHLDKLILNTSTRTAVGVGVGMMPSSGAVSPGERSSGSAATWGYGDREQRRASDSPVRDRERDREARRRERERRSMGMTADTGAGSAESSRTTRPLPVTTASGTDVTSVMSGTATESLTNSPSKGEKTRRGRAMENAVIADDTSVLPVPSHVVLHHLCTSAIKNGVLAVGETVRYRKKYLTTIYYKPT